MDLNISAHTKHALTDLNDSLPVDALSAKKRKLALVKCDRCRDDKVKCLPIERTFPEKCIRCEEKDLPCSAGKKAERKGKHVLKEPSPPLPSSAESADGKKFDDRFEEWRFLLFYKANMAMAMDQMRHMWENLLMPFVNPVPRETFDGLFLPSVIAETIRLIDESMRAALTHNLEDITWTVSPTAITRYMSATLIGYNLMPSFPGTGCPLCSPSDLDVELEAFGEHAEFHIRQKRLERHGELAGSAFHPVDSVRLEEELVRYVSVTKKVQLRARDYFATTKRGFSSSTVEEIGLYHPQTVGLQLLRGFLEVKDCLGRSPLHYFLDDASRPNNTYPTPVAAFYSFLSMFPDTADQNRFVNDQDVLGRSPLHIASQGGLILVVQKLLELGADPGRSTKYNSTPLHYAAAEGYPQTCEALLKYAVVDHVHQMDYGGHTAMGYAILYGHGEIQDMLTVYLRNQYERTG